MLRRDLILQEDTFMKKALSLAAVSLCLLALAVSSYGALLSDTGQTRCYDGSQEIACPQPGQAFYGQDAQYGPNLQSYTKLGYNGVALPDNATEWIMVRDNLTGLMWEIKTDNGSIHDKDNTSIWQSAQNEFIPALNDTSFGGFSDWRLPAIKELSWIADRGTINPMINTYYFPYVSLYYWTSTPDNSGERGPFYVQIETGYEYNYIKTDGGAMAVRGNVFGMTNDFIDNGNGTVTDNATGLIWQQDGPEQTMNWQQALAYCEGLSLAGHDDWRLPNINELQSLVDYSRVNPSINTDYFPSTVSGYYRTSTTIPGSPNSKAWVIDFGFGFVDYYFSSSKSASLYVRAVRGSTMRDSDADGIYDDGDNSSLVGDSPCMSGEIQGCDDNCVHQPNGPTRGTCVRMVGGVLIGTGITCTPEGNECAAGQTCQLEQGDGNGNGNGIGDVCECYGDISGSAGNPDSKVDAFDLLKMKQEFNRTGCTPETCSADVNADGKVDSFDLLIMKVQFNKTGCP